MFGNERDLCWSNLGTKMEISFSHRAWRCAICDAVHTCAVGGDFTRDNAREEWGLCGDRVEREGGREGGVEREREI